MGGERCQLALDALQIAKNKVSISITTWAIISIAFFAGTTARQHALGEPRPARWRHLYPR